MISAFIVAAISADGYIAQSPDQLSLSWTSKEDKYRFKNLTNRARALVMGRKTFDTFKKPLPGRKIFVYSRDFSSPHPDVVPTALDVHSLLASLETDAYTEVAICGGGEIYGMFLDSGVIDRVYLSVEPILFGGGVKLFSGNAQRLALLSETRTESGTMFLDYEVKR